LARPLPGRYSDYDTPWDGSQGSLLGRRSLPRSSPVTSIFREDVWPPPSESSRLMDPISHTGDIDLSRIVDDVMGPSAAAVHFSQQSISSSYRSSAYSSDGGRGEADQVHARKWSDGSQMSLLEAAGLAGPIGAVSTAPVRPSPLAQAETSS
ncbi:hypothetical protein BU15DRAFT_13211, partial [Melanogaster broomeanus]